MVSKSNVLIDQIVKSVLRVFIAVRSFPNQALAHRLLFQIPLHLLTNILFFTCFGRGLPAARGRSQYLLQRREYDWILIELQFAQAGHITKSQRQSRDLIPRDRQELQRGEFPDTFRNASDAVLAKIQYLKFR